jgi:putative membrane protein
MNEGHRQPTAFVIGETKPKHAAPRRKPRAITGIEFAPEEPLGEVTVLAPAPPRISGAWHWGTLLLGSLVSLFALWAGLAITQLIEDLFARSPSFGWIALGAAGVAGFSALAIIAREIWSLARLNRIAHIQADAAHAINSDDAAAAGRAIAALTAIHRHRLDAQRGLQSFRQHDVAIMDPRDRIKLADRYLVAPRDEDAHRIIARTARRVTLLTTVTPMAALDMLFVAAQNLRMLRELATLYGGRPSALSTLRLARMVLGHLAVTGGLALSDNLLQHVIGKGLLGRLSARFGEGAVNGIMTARIGIAARDVCRPIPQETAAKETLGSLMRELVSFEKAEKTP